MPHYKPTVSKYRYNDNRVSFSLVEMSKKGKEAILYPHRINLVLQIVGYNISRRALYNRSNTAIQYNTVVAADCQTHYSAAIARYSQHFGSCGVRQNISQQWIL
jgi:hypothetical protein